MPVLNHSRIVVGVSFVAALGLMAATVASVTATYPGTRNGNLAFAVKDADGNPQITIVAPDGSGAETQTIGAYFHACAAYSADGSKIAYCSNETGAFEIWTMNQDGRNQAQLTRLGGSATFPDYSPGGSLIAFSGTEGTDTHSEVFAVDTATGASVTPLTSCSGGKPGCSNQYPAWSPDGSQIAYIHADDADADGNPVNEQVWVMDADGSNAHALTTDAAPKDQLPDWSPDGTQIAYQSGPGGSGGIWVMNADGSDPHQLAGCKPSDPAPCASGDLFGPTWSPDGRQIAYVALSADGKDRPVMIMDADGTNPHRLMAASPSIQFVPAWQPVGVATPTVTPAASLAASPSLSAVIPAGARIDGRIWVGEAVAPRWFASDGTSLWVHEPTSLVRVDLATSAVTGTIPLPWMEYGYDTTGAGSIWQTDNENDVLLRIDPVTGKVVARIPVAAAPAGVAVTEGSVWVANEHNGSVQRIDPKTNKVVATIPVGPVAPNGPQIMSAGPGGVWVGIQHTGENVRVDAATNTVGLRVPLDGPVASDGKQVWIGVEEGPNGVSQVVQIDPVSGRLITEVELEADDTIGGIAVGLGAVWVSADGGLTRIDPATGRIVGHLDLGGDGGNVVVAGGAVWVTADGQPYVLRIVPQ